MSLRCLERRLLPAEWKYDDSSAVIHHTPLPPIITPFDISSRRPTVSLTFPPPPRPPRAAFLLTPSHPPPLHPPPFPLCLLLSPSSHLIFPHLFFFSNVVCCVLSAPPFSPTFNFPSSLTRHHSHRCSTVPTSGSAASSRWPSSSAAASSSGSWSNSAWAGSSSPR